MPKRKEPELTPAEQYKRFKEAAKKAGVTKDEEEFERAFRKVATTAPRTRQQQPAAASIPKRRRSGDPRYWDVAPDA